MRTREEGSVASATEDPDELRERAVRLYRESEPRPTFRKLGQQLNVHWLAATGTLGVIVVAISGRAVAAGLYAASHRAVVNALNVNDVPPPPTAHIAA